MILMLGIAIDARNFVRPRYAGQNIQMTSPNFSHTRMRSGFLESQSPTQKKGVIADMEQTQFPDRVLPSTTTVAYSRPLAECV
jgi:hypothetical protein